FAPAGGQAPGDVLPVGVEQDQEGVAADPVAEIVAFGNQLTVEQHPQRAALVVGPVLVLHLGAVGAEPDDVLAAHAAAHLALEEVLAAQHRLGVAQREHAAGELEHRAVDRRPVDPGDLVVLAVGVVVAPLGAAQLVAVEDHGAALGDDERRDEVAALAVTQLQDGGVAGLALDPAVPAAVVVGAVAVALAVGLV